MKAIKTKHIPPTATKPGRIKACDGDGNCVTRSVHSFGNVDTDQVHKRAAMALCKKMDWHGCKRLQGGSIGGDYVWVFCYEK
jgi:hypothetical protein